MRTQLAILPRILPFVCQTGFDSSIEKNHNLFICYTMLSVQLHVAFLGYFLSRRTHNTKKYIDNEELRLKRCRLINGTSVIWTIWNSKSGFVHNWNLIRGKPNQLIMALARQFGQKSNNSKWHTLNYMTETYVLQWLYTTMFFSEPNTFFWKRHTVFSVQPFFFNLSIMHKKNSVLHESFFFLFFSLPFVCFSAQATPFNGIIGLFLYFGQTSSAQMESFMLSTIHFWLIVTFV